MYILLVGAMKFQGPFGGYEQSFWGSDQYVHRVLPQLAALMGNFTWGKSFCKYEPWIFGSIISNSAAVKAIHGTYMN